MQTKAPRGPDPRRKFSIDYDVNPIISTKALKVIAAAGGTVAAAIGALGAKAFKNKKEEKGVE